MARPLTPLGELGAKISESLAEDAGSRERAIEQARQRLTADALRPAARSRPFVPAFAFAAAAAVVLVAWFLLGRGPAPLRFDVDGKPGAAQTWLAAPSARPLVVSFSDGTVLDVEPSARARVVDVSQNGADIALESGLLHARVVHTGRSAWRLNAGPFAVRVTGTRFDVRWDPAAQQFSLAVLEGSVVVSGSIVGAERAVRAGEKLLASVAQGRLELISAEMAAAARATKQAAPGARADDAAGTNVPGAEPAAAAVEASGKEAPGSAWRDFAKKGDLRKAFAAAEARGFSGVCEAPARPSYCCWATRRGFRAGPTALPKRCSHCAGVTRTTLGARRRRSRSAKSRSINDGPSAKPPNGLPPACASNRVARSRAKQPVVGSRRCTARAARPRLKSPLVTT
jgi:hypothetical protein